MAEINPKTLKRLRADRRWTLDQLAEKARVDKQTIHRLEKGQGRRARGTTIERLAEALKVEADDLVRPMSNEGESAPTSEPSKSQINLRISNQARNALLLVSERYHVRPAQIVELAPLFFNWAAERCLRKRQERIEVLQQRESEISKELEQFSSDLGNLAGGQSPEIELPDYLSEFWGEQKAALQYGNLFGDHEYTGPIDDLLDELVSEIGEEAEFGGWPHADFSPAYSICKEVATWVANGDEEAMENILQGHAPLHELPKEFWEQLRNRNAVSLADSDKFEAVRQHQAAERVAWLRAHGRLDDTPEAAS
jgi:transcriptional regulator with XRE-family HTH domain